MDVYFREDPRKRLAVRGSANPPRGYLGSAAAVQNKTEVSLPFT